MRFDDATEPQSHMASLRLGENTSPDRLPPPSTMVDPGSSPLGSSSQQVLPTSSHTGHHTNVTTSSRVHSARRLSVELERYHKDPLPFINFAPISEDLNHMLAAIVGPPDSPYHGGTFYIRIDTPLEYPFRSPTFTFITRIYHPNISLHGRVCMDILTTHWSPAFTIPSLLLSIFSLLCDPHFEESFIPKVTKENKLEFEATAQRYTQKWAMDERPSDIEVGNAGLSIVWEDYVEDTEGEMERVIRTISESG
ncbi:MAG: Ubiquitin-conjugating enzyme E2 D2 [Geoglossum simile]|nr:MAG: Ubiquitin-conjugating enzyme E2 D2 [Geoglossum simile]